MEIERKHSTSITLPCIAKKQKKKQTLIWCRHTHFWALFFALRGHDETQCQRRGQWYFFLRNLSLIENHRRIGLRQQRNAAVYQDLQAENDGRRLDEALGKISYSTGKNSHTERNPSEKSWQLDNSECSCCDGSKAAKIWNIHHRASWNGLTQEGQTVCWGFFQIFFIWHCSKSMTCFDSASASIILKRKSRNLNTVCVYSEVFLEQVVACRSCTPGWLTCVSSVNQRQYEMPGLFYIPLFDWPQVVRGTSGAQHVSGVSSWLF